MSHSSSTVSLNSDQWCVTYTLANTVICTAITLTGALETHRSLGLTINALLHRLTPVFLLDDVILEAAALPLARVRLRWNCW